MAEVKPTEQTRGASVTSDPVAKNPNPTPTPEEIDNARLRAAGLDPAEVKKAQEKRDALAKEQQAKAKTTP